MTGSGFWRQVGTVPAVSQSPQQSPVKGWICMRYLTNTSEELSKLQFGRSEIKARLSKDYNTMVRHVKGTLGCPCCFLPHPLAPYQESTEGKGLRQQQERFKLENRRHCLIDGQLI